MKLENLAELTGGRAGILSYAGEYLSKPLSAYKQVGSDISQCQEPNGRHVYQSEQPDDTEETCNAGGGSISEKGNNCNVNFGEDL